MASQEGFPPPFVEQIRIQHGGASLYAPQRAAKQEAQRKAQVEAMAANAEQQQQGANLTFGGDFAAAANQQAPPYMFQGYGYGKCLYFLAVLLVV